MPKLAKDFLIVEPGKVYPVTIPAGSECPDWAIPFAETFGALEKKAIAKAPRNKAINAKDLEKK